MRRVLCFLSVLTAGMCGCTKSMQFVLPDDFHGQVTVQCISTGRPSTVVQVDRFGTANADCPPIQPTITVTRAGKPVTIVGQPTWREDRDGQKLGLTFRVD